MPKLTEYPLAPCDVLITLFMLSKESDLHSCTAMVHSSGGSSSEASVRDSPFRASSWAHSPNLSMPLVIEIFRCWLSLVEQQMVHSSRRVPFKVSRSSAPFLARHRTSDVFLPSHLLAVSWRGLLSSLRVLISGLYRDLLVHLRRQREGKWLTTYPSCMGCRHARTDIWDAAESDDSIRARRESTGGPISSHRCLIGVFPNLDP